MRCVTPCTLSPCQSCALTAGWERRVTRRKLWLGSHLHKPQNLPLLAPACRQLHPEPALSPDTNTAAGAAPLRGGALATEGRRNQILLLHFAGPCRLIASPQAPEEAPVGGEGAALHLAWVAEHKEELPEGHRWSPGSAAGRRSTLSCGAGRRRKMPPHSISPAVPCAVPDEPANTVRASQLVAVTRVGQWSGPGI